VPDCKLEDSAAYVAAMRDAALAPIFLLSPRTSDERLRALGQAGDGLAYAVARKGVTGAKTEFSTELEAYLARCRQATELPLAVGFGIESARDVRFLVGKADVAVVGSQALRVLEQAGIAAVAAFIAELSNRIQHHAAAVIGRAEPPHGDLGRFDAAHDVVAPGRRG